MVINTSSSFPGIGASQVMDIKVDKSTDTEDARAIEESNKGEGSNLDQNSNDIFLKQPDKDYIESGNSDFLTYNSKGAPSGDSPQEMDSSVQISDSSGTTTENGTEPEESSSPTHEMKSSADKNTSFDFFGGNMPRSIDLIV